jgi:hypothetical protein
MRCAEVNEGLPGYVRDGYMSLAARRHLSRCPDCRSEMRRYETLLRSLEALRSTTAEPPPELLRALAAIPEVASLGHVMRERADALTEHLARHRRVYAGGMAVALAGAAGAALWRSRARRPVAA